MILGEGLQCHVSRLVIHSNAHASDICLAAFIDTAHVVLSGCLYVIFIALDTGFVLLVWIDLAPTLLRQKRELCVAYIA